MKQIKYPLIAAALSCQLALASPWIDSEQSTLKHSIDLLVSYGLIQRPVNQYPLMWQGLVQDLAKIDVHKIDETAQFAVTHLRHALKHSQRRHYSSVKVLTNSEQVPLNSFGNKQVAKSAVESSSTITSDTISAKVNVNYTNEPLDNKRVNHYGSHLAWLVQNWSISAERLSYWWGPSNENALLLSNNASPMKALRVSRANSNYTGPTFLSFIGPWQITGIAAKQKPFLASKHSGDFWGLRLSSMPITGLELAFSSTASDFVFKLPQLNEHTTQTRLTSLDFKYSNIMATIPFSIYGELTGQNQNGGIPKNRSYSFGLEGFKGSSNYRAKGYIEYTDTTSHCPPSMTNNSADFPCQFMTPNEGADYTERDQWLGASIGPQAKSLTLAVDYYRTSGLGGYAKYKNISFDALNLDRQLIELGYQQGLFNGLLKAGVTVWQDEAEDKINHTVKALHLSWEYQF